MNLFDYINVHKEDLKPPVCNKMIHNDGKLRVMIIGGPNLRKDYHMNMGEEIFYQIKGDMCLKVMENNEPRDVIIREGEFFILPGKIPHSPQRFENTMGLVIERMRPEGELDGLRYFTDDTNKEVLWQRFFHVTDLGQQLVPLIEDFFASEEFKTRVPSASMPPNAWEPDTTTLLAPPFLLSSRFRELAEKRAPVRLGNKEFIVDLVGGETMTPPLPVETECWLYVLEGTCTANGRALSTHDTFLSYSGLTDLTVDARGRVLVVFTTAC